MFSRLTKNIGDTIRTSGALSSVGLSFVFAIVLGTWFGRALDRWLGTDPLCFISFFFLGSAAGVLNVYRVVSRAFPPRGVPREPPSPPEEDNVRPVDD